MYCTHCGFGNADDARYCQRCGLELVSPSPPVAQPEAISVYGGVYQPVVQYAGFWLRFVAILVDSALLVVLITVFFGFDYWVEEEFFTIEVLLANLINWLYFALWHSSPHQATIGKRAVGIKVTDLDGRRISFARATGRYFAAILSGCILLIGYMMAGWTAKKRALHDMIADTLVVRTA